MISLTSHWHIIASSNFFLFFPSNGWLSGSCQLLFCGQLCNRCLRQKKIITTKPTNTNMIRKKKKWTTTATKIDMRFITVHTRVVSSLRKFNRDVLLKGSLIQVQCRPDSLYNLKMTYLRLQPLCSQWYCVQFTSVANFLCPSVGLHLAVIAPSTAEKKRPANK